MNNIKNDFLELKNNLMQKSPIKKNKGVYISKRNKAFLNYSDETSIYSDYLRKHTYFPETSFFTKHISVQGNMLDAGSGDGMCSAYYARHNPNKNVWLVDSDLSALLRAKERKIANLKCLCGDLIGLPFRDKSFKSVISVYVVEHMLQKQLMCFFKEVNRVLDEKGEFVVATDGPIYDMFFHPFERLIIEKRWFTSGWLKKDGNGHVNLMFPDTLKKYLINAGFSIKKEEYYYMFGRFKIIKKLINKMPFSLGKNLFTTVYLFVCQKRKEY